MIPLPFAPLKTLTSGGAPGPVKNLNAEVYFPPYLFKQDGSGEFAPRPEIVSAPEQQLGWAEAFNVEVAVDVNVSRVVLVRTGAVTHAFNNEQRFLALPFVQVDTQIQLAMPAERAAAPPGYYLLFVFDVAGVPSVARILRLNG